MWGPAAHCSKTHKQAGWWKGKFALFHMLATGEEGGAGKYLCKGQLSLWQPMGQELFFFLRQKEGATCKNRTVSSDSHLQIGHRWSDQQRLGCLPVHLRFQGPFAPVYLWPVLCCDPSCPGHSPVIKKSPPGVLESVIRLTGCGSGYHPRPCRKS